MPSFMSPLHYLREEMIIKHKNKRKCMIQVHRDDACSMNFGDFVTFVQDNLNKASLGYLWNQEQFNPN